MAKVNSTETNAAASNLTCAKGNSQGHTDPGCANKGAASHYGRDKRKLNSAPG